MIEAMHLDCHQGGQAILEDISLQIKPGVLSVLLGPNGSGKSTLLQTLTGSLPFKKGTLRMDGQDLSSYSLQALAAKRAVLSQANPISFPFTALEIVMMGRHLDTLKRQKLVAQEALELLDAHKLGARLYTALSGGEQQRVQLARILSQLWDADGGYLFLDEPTSALDLKHQHQLLQIARAWAHEKGFGVCIVLHDLSLASQYADQVVFLKNRKIYLEGLSELVLTPEAIEQVFEVPLVCAKAAQRGLAPKHPPVSSISS